jgi:hypothetical protein
LYIKRHKGNDDVRDGVSTYSQTNRLWQDTVLERDGIYLAEKFNDGNEMIDVNLEISTWRSGPNYFAILAGKV